MRIVQWNVSTHQIRYIRKGEYNTHGVVTHPEKNRLCFGFSHALFFVVLFSTVTSMFMHSYFTEHMVTNGTAVQAARHCPFPGESFNGTVQLHTAEFEPGKMRRGKWVHVSAWPELIWIFCVWFFSSSNRQAHRGAQQCHCCHLVYSSTRPGCRVTIRLAHIILVECSHAIYIDCLPWLYTRAKQMADISLRIDVVRYGIHIGMSKKKHQATFLLSS